MESNAPLIDREFGLSQLSGNATLLTKMITKFKVEFSSVPNEVKSLIQEGNIREAKLKVHTTKGISGNLGLSAVFQCSKKLDQELKAEIVNNDTLDEFSNLMVSTCIAIESFDESGKTDSDNQPDTRDNEEYKSKLIQKLNAHEFVTESELDDWLPHIGAEATTLSTIRDAIDALDYDTALNILKG
ncbi:MAG: hypothetical protein AAGJ37_01530 [Pseudomonadota bacterium]